MKRTCNSVMLFFKEFMLFLMGKWGCRAVISPRLVPAISFVLMAFLSPLQAQLQVTAAVPSQGLPAANYYSPVELTFDRSLDTTSVSPASIRISGKYQGRYGFTYEYIDSLNLLRLRPESVFMVGEFITVTLTSPGLQGTDGSSLSSPFQLSFRTGPVQGNLLAFPLPPFDIPLLEGDQQPAKIAIADFNKDNYPDVAVLNSSSNTLTILLDQVLTEGIAIPQAFQGHATGATPIDLAVADFDNDSNLDVAVVNFNEDNLLIFWGNGNGTFAAPTSITTGGRPSSAAAADYYDGDGLVDLAISVFGEDKLQVYRNNGARSFTLADELSCQESPFGVDSHDFDGDGDPDLAVINNGARSVSFFRNENFQSWQSLPVVQLDQRPVALKWENVLMPGGFGGGDKFPELMVLSSDLTLIGDAPLSPSVSQSRLSILQYNPLNGNMLLADTLSYTGNAQAFALANVDYGSQLNPDLDVDLLIGNYTGSSLHLLQNNDFGGWAGQFDSVAATPNPRALATADFDRDGDEDVLIANHLDNQLQLLISYPFDLDLQFPDSVINFGDVFVGDTADTVVNYDPNAGIDLQVQGGVADPVNFGLEPENFTVRSGEPEPVNFFFMPQDTIGYTTLASFITDHPLQQDPMTVLLIGRGVYVEIVVDPILLDFGTVPPGMQRTLPLAIRNRGNGVLNLSEFQNQNPAFTHTGQPGPVAAHSAIQIDVTFQPPVVGVYRDTLFISSNDRDNPLVGVILIGNSTQNGPQITSPDTVTATEDIFFSYTATAMDPDGDPVSFHFENLAPWMSAAGDIVSGTPREGDQNTTFRVIASDGFLEDTLDVYVIVIPVNDPPTIEEIPPQTIGELETLTFNVVASDPEGETLTLSAFNLPPGAVFTDNGNNSGAFSWTPPFESAGSYAVSFRAVETVSVPPLADTAVANIEVIAKEPDLVMEQLTVSPNSVYLNQVATISAVVTNREAPVTNAFRVILTVDNAEVFDSTFAGMALNQSVQISAPGRFGRLGEIIVAAEADRGNAIAEVSETNNRLETRVTVEPGDIIVRPNPFTPNGDNFNDRAEFSLRELGVVNPFLEIYDTRGRRIQTVSNLQDNTLAWDGNDQSGEAQLPGVYLFILKDGTKNVAKGYVVLAR